MAETSNQNSSKDNDPSYFVKKTQPKPASSGIGTFSSLRHPNFRLFFIGTVFTNAAQWIQQVTLSWLVYHLTGSGTILGSINLVRAVGSMGVIPFAGNIIDQYNRKKLLLLVNGYLFVISFTLGISLVLGYQFLWILFVFSFLGGIAWTIDYNLRQVTIFNIVPRADTPNAVAVIQTGWGFMRSLGPALGGFLILWFGPGGNFLVQAGAYILISFTISHITFPKTTTNDHRSSFLMAIRGGITYVAHSRTTRAFTLMGFVLPLLIVPVYVILPPIYAEDVFKGGPDTLGFLMSAVGVGSIIGGLVSASLSRVERRGVVQIGALFFLSLSLLAFAYCSVLWTALIFLGLSGVFEMIFLTSNQTLLQLSIPDNIRGMVTSVTNLNAALLPVGGVIAGLGADIFGGPQPVTIILASMVAMVSILAFIFSSSIRGFRMSEAITSFENSD